MCLGALVSSLVSFIFIFPFSQLPGQVSTSYFLQRGLEPRKGILSDSVILS